MSRNNIVFRTPYTSSFENIEQLIIRVGKGCNFKCVFCNVADNEKILDTKPKVKEIIAFTFYKIKFSNFKSKYLNVTISGGEPSIFQTETIFVLKYFKKYFESKGIKVFFDLQTNASNIDINFANKLKLNGIYSAMVSFHTINSKEYKEVIGVSYDIFGPRVFSGVKNLIDSGIEVSFNIVLNNITKNSFFDTVKYLIDNFPEVINYNIGFYQPHGMANKNHDNLYVGYEEIYFIYNKVLSYIKSRGKKSSSHFVGLPLCYINDFSDSLEYFTNKKLIKNGTDSSTLIHNINDDNKKHLKECKNCLYKRFCSGIWKEFDGYQKLKPVNYYKYFENLDNISCKIFSPSYNIKSIFDSGIRQLFISYDDFINYKDLLLKYSFFVISIVGFDCNKTYNIDDFLGCNLQIDNLDLNLIEFLKEVLKFNNNKSFHFKIKIDLNLYNGNFNVNLLNLVPIDEYININLINFNKNFFIDKSNLNFYYK